MRKVTGLAKAIDEAHRHHAPGQHPKSIKYAGEEYELGEPETGESMEDEIREHGHMPTAAEEAAEEASEESTEPPYMHEHQKIRSRTTGRKIEISMGPQSGGRVPANPFASLAQAGYLHSHPEILGKKKLAEFDAATKGRKLPKHVKGK